MKKVGIASLFANPIHQGHIEYLNASKLLVDFLLVVVNNDEQVKLKGSQEFMNQNERLSIIQNLKSVSMARISSSDTLDIAKDIESIAVTYPNDLVLFFNSGDRVTSDPNEKQACMANGVIPVFLDLPKRNSSRHLLSKINSG